MWELTGYAAKIRQDVGMQMPWPDYDESKTVAAHTEMAVQVNGKLKGTVVVPTDSEEAGGSRRCHGAGQGEKATEDMSVVKTILVKNKLVNLIVKPAK